MHNNRKQYLTIKSTMNFYWNFKTKAFWWTEHCRDTDVIQHNLYIVFFFSVQTNGVKQNFSNAVKSPEFLNLQLSIIIC